MVVVNATVTVEGELIRLQFQAVSSKAAGDRIRDELGPYTSVRLLEIVPVRKTRSQPRIAGKFGRKAA